MIELIAALSLLLHKYVDLAVALALLACALVSDFVKIRLMPRMTA